MVFLRCNPDHHGIALVGSMTEKRRMSSSTTSPSKSLPSTRSSGRVTIWSGMEVKIDFAGRRRAGCQLAVEFRDPDNHRLEIYWGIDQIGSDGHVRPSTEWKGAQSLEQAIADPVPGQDTTLHDPICSMVKKVCQTDESPNDPNTVRCCCPAPGRLPGRRGDPAILLSPAAAQQYPPPGYPGAAPPPTYPGPAQPPAYPGPPQAPGYYGPGYGGPTTPPPPLQQEAVPPPPGAAMEWTPGFWNWGHRGWVWMPGRYVARPYAHAVWVPGR